MYSFILYLIATFIIYKLINALRIRFTYDIHKIPKAPAYPIIGHMHHFSLFDKPRFSVWLYKWYQKLGQPPIMLMETMFSQMVVVTDNAFCHEKIFSHDGYIKSKAIYENFTHLLDEIKPTYNLFTIVDLNPYVKAVRKAIFASFSVEGLKQKFPIILSCLKKFEQIILDDKNKKFEGQSMFSLLALDIIMRSGFEYEYDTYNKGEKFIEDTYKCAENANFLTFLPFLRRLIKMFPNSSMSKKFSDKSLHTIEISDETMAAYKARKDINEENLSLISNLSKVIDPRTGEKLSEFQIKGEISNTIIGAYVTTGKQLSWIYAILTLYPECEEKILKELKNHNLIGNQSKELEYSDISKLAYLDAFIKECLRMATVHQSVTIRDLSHDDIVCGYRLPKGMPITLLGRAIHRKEEYWDNPLEFRPERWMQENTSSMAKNMCTFSFGPRGCPGSQFALLEIMMTIIYLIPKYKIKFINEDKKTLEELLSECYDIFMSVHDGLYFEMENRI